MDRFDPYKTDILTIEETVKELESRWTYGNKSMCMSAVHYLKQSIEKHIAYQEIDQLNKDDLGLCEPVKKDNAWISVDEKLPNTGGKYLVFCQEKENGHRASIIQTARWHSTKKIWFSPMAFTTIHSVTHWMKLPAPPQE